jgi:hypothetical protein
MKRDKLSAECKTFIGGFKAHGIDIMNPTPQSSQVKEEE